MALADELGLDASWRRAFGEVERMVGGRVVAARPQARWRPAWFLDVDCGGEIRSVYFRGDRGVGQIAFYTLEHECGVLQVLEAQGIPVPHVYGFCRDPLGIVMERAPGRENLATEEDPEKRVATLDHYIELLVEMHRIDVAAFEAIGLRRPKDAQEIGIADLPLWEKSFHAQKQHPEPLIEFALDWLSRKVPQHRTRVSFCAGDSGQFLFEDGRVTAVIDLELAFLGDPLADLGALRSRDISEPLGDLSHAMRRYAQLSGEPIDVDVMHYHTVRFALNTPLAVAPLCRRPPAGLNFAQYLGWNLIYARLPVEVIAELEGVELERPSLPEPGASLGATANEALVRMLESEAGDSYEIDTALRVAQYARELDRRGPRIEAEDLEEASRLVGRRLASWDEADAALEQVVAVGAQARQAELLRYFYRRTLRHEALLRPALRELQDVEFQKIRL